MKVQELFEAYTPPVKNKKLSFTSGGRKVGTGKQGIPVGGTKEWLKAFGATSADINQALRVVRQSPEYRAVKATGLSDESTDRHNTLGSIMFVGKIKDVSWGGKPTERRVKFTVQANGKIDETAQNDHHRAPVNSPKPRIVPGDAVQSIAKTMQASLAKIATTMEARIKKGASNVKAAS